METAAKKTILRIELWHGLMLSALLALLGQTGWVDPKALLLGGIFMGINFFLLSYGVAWILTPLAGKGRIKAGVGFLVLKIVLFLGLLTTLFFRFDLDAISFALGFSTLIFAIFVEVLRTTNAGALE
jgi:NADH:ubiquinone oxidoreductase subunit K